jgi:DivIVA domain-containing protein
LVSQGGGTRWAVPPPRRAGAQQGRGDRHGTIGGVTVVMILAVLAVLGVALAVAAGRGDGLEPAPVDAPPPGLPTDGPLTAADIAGLRFRVVLRGYRMDEVDEALDRLAAELSARDARIAELQADERLSTAPRDAEDADA